MTVEAFNHILNLGTGSLELLSHQFVSIDTPVLAISIVALSMLCAWPGRLAISFGMAGVALLASFAGAPAGLVLILFVICCGLVGLVRSRRRLSTIQQRLDKLSRAVQDLELAENRRLIQSAKSSTASLEEDSRSSRGTVNQTGRKAKLRRRHPELHNILSDCTGLSHLEVNAGGLGNPPWT